MPISLTLKNIPDAVYARLKIAALSHRRSMNSEAIVCLEAALAPAMPSAEEALARVRKLREALPIAGFDAASIDVSKREGRP